MVGVFLRKTSNNEISIFQHFLFAYKFYVHQEYTKIFKTNFFEYDRMTDNISVFRLREKDNGRVFCPEDTLTPIIMLDRITNVTAHPADLRSDTELYSAATRFCSLSKSCKIILADFEDGYGTSLNGKIHTKNPRRVHPSIAR